MYCPNCGVFNKEGLGNCRNCTKPLPKVDFDLPQPQAPPDEQTEAQQPPARPDFYPGIPGSQYNYSPRLPFSGGSEISPGFNFPLPTAYSPAFPGYCTSYEIDRVGVAQHKAGFLVRLGAWIIDSIITSLVSFIVFGIPELIYWTGFVTRYGREITANCPRTPGGPYDTAAKICTDTFDAIFRDGREISAIISISLGFGLLALILNLSYLVGMTASGATVGKKVFGLKVVTEKGNPPGWGRAFLRMGPGYAISNLFLGLGFIWVALDAQKQGWHDKIAGTFVVRI